MAIIFKPNDLVRCIDANNTVLVIGKVYIVNDTLEDRFVELIGFNTFFYSSRFILVGGSLFTLGVIED